MIEDAQIKKLLIDDERIEELLEDHERGHSEFQIRHFIIRKAGVTPYGMYKQALREISKRFLARCHIKAKLSQAKHAMELAQYEEESATLERELEVFVQIAEELKEQIGPLDEATKNKLEAAMWKEHIVQRAQMERVAHYYGISVETVHAIATLPSVVDYSNYLDQVLSLVEPVAEIEA